MQAMKILVNFLHHIISTQRIRIGSCSSSKLKSVIPFATYASDKCHWKVQWEKSNQNDLYLEDISFKVLTWCSKTCFEVSNIGAQIERDNFAIHISTVAT